MAYLVFVQLLRKKFIFHLYGNIEGRFWGLPVTSSMTSLLWKYFFWHNLARSFNTWCQIEAAWIFKKKIKLRNFRAGANFFVLSKRPRACPTFWVSDRRSSSNIREVMTISKCDLLFDLMASSVTSSTPKSIQLIPQTGSIFVPSLVLIAQTVRPVWRR